MLLEQALNLIIDNTPVLDVEEVSLEECCGRVCTGNNRATLPVPCYDQSTRDGYAVRGNGEPAEGGERSFQICGEIPAGPCSDLLINPGESYRIMTGGLIPDGTDRIVPQEQCWIAGTDVIIHRDQLSKANRFVRRSGSDCKERELITAGGTRLNEIHAARFASSGNSRLEVYGKPRVAFLCSGSELVIDKERLRPGQKFSSNHYLLKFLIQSYGGIAYDYGIVEDDPNQIRRMLDTILASDVDIFVTTGGVGPGKYDLFSNVLHELGAKIHYRSLQVRPGKSTLFGTIANKLYFGLPGPPTAVDILFHELMGPVLRKMQGCKEWSNQRLDARLNHDISLKSSEVLCFKEGRSSIRDGRLTVKFPDRLQTSNCFLMMEPGRTGYKQGDQITISPIHTR